MRSESFNIVLCVLSLLAANVFAQGTIPKKAADQLDRTSPRSSVTAFLEACHNSNYMRAAQYLDLRDIPERKRDNAGPRLAKELEQALNSDSHFNVLQLSQNADGNHSDNANPLLDHVTKIQGNGNEYTIDVARVTQAGLEVWLFSPATVAAIPKLTTVPTNSKLESRLPGFLVSVDLLETPLWKWIALIALAMMVIGLLRLTGRIFLSLMKRVKPYLGHSGRWLWVPSVLEPWLVFLSALLFGVAEQFIDPSALSRLYIARGILLVVVGSFAWCLMNLVDLFLSRIDTMLNPRQRVVSHSVIYLGRRAAKVAIFVLAMIIVLDNWGYHMTTMIAGLGVGGIAVALAAQSTIANVFGGVSVIGDGPVMIGDFGNFGGVLGTVEAIGMRSTRVRTLNRTLMSIPNSAFAGMNLENYADRDKILFNPTLQVKRGTPKEKMRQLMKSLENLLKSDKRMEVGPTPIRISNFTAASFTMEIFAYALTPDIDEFYKIEADLFLDIDEALNSAGVDLA